VTSILFNLDGKKKLCTGKQSNENYSTFYLPVDGNKFVAIYWDSLANAFVDCQDSIGYKSINAKLSARIYYCVMQDSTAPKMIVSLAAKFFSNSLSLEERTTVCSFLESRGWLGDLEVVEMIKALDKLRAHMNGFMDIMNSRDKALEAKFGGKKNIYRRESYNDIESQSKMEELRAVAIYLDSQLDLIKGTQKFDASGKLIEGLTQSRNYISMQTMNVARNICYGVPSLLWYYSVYLFPGITKLNLIKIY